MAESGKADSIVIAGGTIDRPDLREVAGVDTRAEIDMLGKPMLEWTTRAVRDAETINRIAVVGNPEVVEPIAGDLADSIVEEGVDEGVDEVENLFTGLEALPGATWAVMLAGDIPLLTAEAVDDLVTNAPGDADVVFPICEEADVMRDFPDRDWTLVKTPDGSFTGGCGFLFAPEPVKERRAWVQEVFDSRRNPWKLMRIWGLWFGIMALLHQVSIAEAEAKISEVLGLRAQAYISPYTELCLDLDYAPDVEQVRKHLVARQ